MPKPLYAYPVIRILNEGRDATGLENDLHAAKPDFAGVKALVVDDEPMNLVVASGLFREYNMEVDTAGSGPEAIRAFRERDYDVVFMDHMMPGMDGVEAMNRIKDVKDGPCADTPIVVLTANAVSGSKEQYLKDGFDGYLSKPIDSSRLFEEIRKLL